MAIDGCEERGDLEFRIIGPTRGGSYKGKMRDMNRKNFV
jgi:hypothetical protein